MRIYIKGFERSYEKYPLVLVDIGASGGLEPHWKPAQDHLRLIGFEPDAREFEKIRQQNNGKKLYLNCGLLNEQKTVDLHLTKKQQASSIFRPNMDLLLQFPDVERFSIVGKAAVKVDTLDNQLSANDVRHVDFIKVDTQGSELMILQGAQRTLEHSVFACEIEVEFAPIYEGQPLFADIDPFMRQHHFHLFDLQSFRWKREAGKDLGKGKGQIVFANALYIRDLKDFLVTVRNIQDQDERKARVLNAMSICFLYGYFDLAYDLRKESGNIFSDQENALITARIKRGIEFDNVWEWGKETIKEFVPVKSSWAARDRKIGNL